MSTMKEGIKIYYECITWHFLTPLRLFVDAFLRKKKLVLVYRAFGSSLGDQFMLSAMIDTLFRQYGYRAIVFTKRPVFFLNNPNVAHIFDYETMPGLARSLLKSAVKHLRGRQILCCGEEAWRIRTLPWRTRHLRQPPPRTLPLK